MKYDFTTNEYVYTRVNGSEYRCLDSFPTIVQTFWTNDPVDWDLEKKITWDEIAPSLQELIIRKLKFSDFDTVFQNRVLKIENDIVTVNNNLNIEINTRQRGDQLLQNQIDDLKRRMTAAEARLTVLENRMDEAERQIELLWIEIRKLWKEIADIWGSDGKNTSHDITNIWKKIGDVENRVTDVEKWIELFRQNVRMKVIDASGWYYYTDLDSYHKKGNMWNGDWEVSQGRYYYCEDILSIKLECYVQVTGSGQMLFELVTSLKVTFLPGNYFNSNNAFYICVDMAPIPLGYFTKADLNNWVDGRSQEVGPPMGEISPIGFDASGNNSWGLIQESIMPQWNSIDGWKTNPIPDNYGSIFGNEFANPGIPLGHKLCKVKVKDIHSSLGVDGIPNVFTNNLIPSTITGNFSNLSMNDLLAMSQPIYNVNDALTALKQWGPNHQGEFITSTEQWCKSVSVSNNVQDYPAWNYHK